MQPRRQPVRRVPVFMAAFALALVALASGALAQGPRRDEQTLIVTHDAVMLSLADAASDGHQLGDLRVTSIPTRVDPTGEVGRLDAMLTTVGIDTPDPGDESRLCLLVFSFQDDADQIVVQGTASASMAGGMTAAATPVVLPVIGGSGAYASATGWVETEHLADGTWRHTFHLAGGPGRGLPDRPLGSGLP